MKMKLIALCMAIAALPAFTQESVRGGLSEEEIAATIESDSREALELFVEWSSVLHRVRRDFEESDREDPPEEMGQWALRALRDLKLRGNRVEIPRLDVDPEKARLFAELIYQVFYEGPFREWCLEKVGEDVTRLHMDMQQQQTEWMARLEGMSPENYGEQIAEARQQQFGLQMEQAEAEARAGALHERIEKRMREREMAAEEVPSAIQRQQASADSLRAELERLQRQKEKLGTRETRDIEELRRRLMDVEMATAHRMDEWRARQEANQEDMSQLRVMLIEAETNFVGAETQLRVLAERIAALSEIGREAAEIARERMELERRAEELSRTYDRIEDGRMFGLKNIPQLRFK